MIWTIFPQKDTVLYERYPTQNAGSDSILELMKYETDLVNDKYSSRILMKFDLTELSQSLSNNVISGSVSYFLNLFVSEAYQIPFLYTIDVFPVSSSWEMGTGKWADNPLTEEGTSWKYRDGEMVATYWVSSSTPTFSPHSTGSWNSTPGGGTWFYELSGSVPFTCSQSFENENADLNINVTQIVEKWLDGTIQNEGFLIKWSDESDATLARIRTIKFFSKESHTIYLPKLCVKWVDSTFETSSYNYSQSFYVSTTSSINELILPSINFSTASLYSFTTSSIQYQTISGSEIRLIDYNYPLNNGSVTSSFCRLKFTGSFDGYLSGSFNSLSLASGSGSGVCFSPNISTYQQRTQINYTRSSGSYIGYFSGSLISEFTGSAFGKFSGSFVTESFTGSLNINNYRTFMPASVMMYHTTASSYLYSTSSNDLEKIGDTDDIVVYPSNLKQFYDVFSKEEILVKSRLKFPSKNTFVTSSLYRLSYYIPEIYYSILDAHSEDIVINFDNEYTRLSYGGMHDCNYFKFWFNELQPERNYRFVFKAVRNNVVEIFDNKYYFKIVR